MEDQLLSKKQRKRLEKQKLWEERKEEFKKKKKEKKKEKQANKQKDPENKPTVSKKVFLEEFDKKMETASKVVIDCAFEGLMTEKEVRSLSKQISFIYSANKKNLDPYKIILFGVGPVLKENLFKNGAEGWIGVQIVEGTEFNEIFKALAVEKEDLVYFSGDATEETETLLPEKLYVIGGLVDRNRHKNICLERANKMEIKTEKLPIGRFLDLKTSSILATNHVFDVMLAYKQSKSWKEAFDLCIPKRKIN